MLGRMLRARLETLIPAAYGGLAAFAGRMRARVNDKLRSPVARLRFWERVLDGPIAELALARNEPAAEAALAEALDRAAEGGEGPSLGEVYLVGAGPGDADLLTFRALRLMQKADVVLYDRLVDPSIVDLARREAERIYVGKRRADHALPQEEISDLLVRLAREGKRVLRLKGGDPFIFGRGGEEIEKLAEHGIPFQVCPGVTAATACAAYAGIPLTHRDHAQACVFVTGHGRDGAVDLDWETLVRPNQTVAIYMGLDRLEELTQAFVARGADPALPAAIIDNGARVKPARRRRDARRRRRQGARGEFARPDDRHRRHGGVAARQAELVCAGGRSAAARFAAGRRRAIDAVQGLQHRRGRAAGETVVDRLGLAARFDQLHPPEHRQMLRQRRLAEADDALQFADRLLAFDQVAQHQQAPFAAHRAQQARRRFGVGAELVRVDREGGAIPRRSRLEGDCFGHRRPEFRFLLGFDYTQT